MATGLKCRAGRDRGSVGDNGGIVRASDFPAADANGRSREIVKLYEFVGGAIWTTHSKFADHNGTRNGLYSGRKVKWKTGGYKCTED